MGSLAGSAGQQRRITQTSNALKSMSTAQSRTQVGEVMLTRNHHKRANTPEISDAKRLSLSQTTHTRIICSFQVAVEHIIRAFVPGGATEQIDLVPLHEHIRKAFSSLIDLLIVVCMQRNEHTRETPPLAEQKVYQGLLEQLSSVRDMCPP